MEGGQLQNAGLGRDLFAQDTANAANVYGGLEPTLAAESAHPVGYTPAQKASINTAAQQSAGGTTAGAVGGGNLYAARTRNSGGAPAAIASGVRSAGQNLSRAAVGTQVQDANLGEKRQASAMGGLGSLYDTTSGNAGRALESSNQALSGADESAANNPWLKILQQSIQSAGQVGAAYEGRG